MNASEVSSEITDLNIAYVLLAQKLLRHDKAAGMLRLGLARQAADYILGLSPARILRLSAADALLCGFRLGEVDPDAIDTGHDRWAQQAHLFIVLANQRGAARQGVPA